MIWVISRIKAREFELPTELACKACPTQSSTRIHLSKSWLSNEINTLYSLFKNYSTIWLRNNFTEKLLGQIEQENSKGSFTCLAHSRRGICFGRCGGVAHVRLRASQWSDQIHTVRQARVWVLRLRTQCLNSIYKTFIHHNQLDFSHINNHIKFYYKD